MAIPVARVHLAMAHAALPALLPTPPKSKMLPLLPTPPCVVLLLPTSPPKPSRADAAERWDARKNVIAPPSKPGRADAVDRWDARKARPPSPASSVSIQRNKKSSPPPPPPPSCSSSSPVSRAPRSAAARWGSTSQAISRAPSSAERWDAHKKQPRPAPSEELDDGANASSTGSNNVELDMPRRRQRAPYAGPVFFVAAPEPSMLPMHSSFMARVAA